MRSLFALLKQLVFGVDTISAIVFCAVFGLVFDPHPRFFSAIGYLMLAGFGNYLPDFDLLIFLPFRNRFGWESHWDVGHHPPIVVPFAAVIVWWAARTTGVGEPVFATVLTIVCVSAHFVHDSTEVNEDGEEMGCPLFSPFRKDIFISFKHWWPRRVSSVPFHRRQCEINKLFELAPTGEGLTELGEITTIWHFVAWVIAVWLFCYWAMF